MCLRARYIAEHPGVGDGPGPVVGLEGVGLDLEELADGPLDVLQGDGPRGVADRVAEGGPGQGQVEPLAGQRGVGDQAVQGPFQLADAGAEVVGDVGEDRLGHDHAPGGGLGLEDRPAGGGVGGVELDDHPAEEPGGQLVGQLGDLPGVLVGRSGRSARPRRPGR